MHVYNILMLRCHSAYNFGITGSFEALTTKTSEVYAVLNHHTH